MDQIKSQGSPKAAGFPDNSRESLASSINRSKEALGTAASEAMEAGGADFKALQRDLSELKETLAKIISRAGDDTAKSARVIAGQVSTAAGDIAQRGANVAWVATDLVLSRAQSLSES